ncbi:DUF1453 domain-containing protein [Streptacidiphilus cavernicola]|uniref:DUF1453 domain-containing protein n=1 Tax=Streptacidiphilus cavernicola TaxID=3342716 RepID=A0ABV6W1I7_9ACTN
MNSAANIALVVVVVVLVVARQFKARQLNADGRKMLVVPAVLAVLAFRNGGLIDPAHKDTAVALLVIGILVEVGMGFAWGFTTRIWRDGSGAVWYKGTRATAFAWTGMLLVRVAFYAVGAALGVAAGQGALLLSLAAVLLVRKAVVTWRARELGPSYGFTAAN